MGNRSTHISVEVACLNFLSMMRRRANEWAYLFELATFPALQPGPRLVQLQILHYTYL